MRTGSRRLGVFAAAVLALALGAAACADSTGPRLVCPIDGDGGPPCQPAPHDTTPAPRDSMYVCFTIFTPPNTLSERCEWIPVP